MRSKKLTNKKQKIFSEKQKGFRDGLSLLFGTCATHSTMVLKWQAGCCRSNVKLIQLTRVEKAVYKLLCIGFRMRSCRIMRIRHCLH